MNLEFLKKIKNPLKMPHNTIVKPFAETAPKPLFLWNLLLIVYVFFIILFIILVVLSYNFLTGERVGVADANLATTPKVNVQKIEKVNTFFDDRENRIFSAYSKVIIDPIGN